MTGMTLLSEKKVTIALMGDSDQKKGCTFCIKEGKGEKVTFYRIRGRNQPCAGVGGTLKLRRAYSPREKDGARLRGNSPPVRRNRTFHWEM